MRCRTRRSSIRPLLHRGPGVVPVRIPASRCAWEGRVQVPWRGARRYGVLGSGLHCIRSFGIRRSGRALLVVASVVGSMAREAVRRALGATEDTPHPSCSLPRPYCEVPMVPVHLESSSRQLSSRQRKQVLGGLVFLILFQSRIRLS